MYERQLCILWTRSVRVAWRGRENLRLTTQQSRLGLLTIKPALAAATATLLCYEPILQSSAARLHHAARREWRARPKEEHGTVPAEVGASMARVTATVCSAVLSR